MIQKARLDELNAIIEDNLTLLEAETLSAFERRFVQLRDRADIIFRRGQIIENENRIDDFSAMFSNDMANGNMPDEFQEYFESVVDTRTFSDKLTVCRFLASEFSKRQQSVLTQLFTKDSVIESPRIAYFQNAYADAAFRIFSEVLDTPSVIYASDFTSVCEEVYYGRSDMCMLPMDSSRDAKLISFYRLIDKYELSPVLSCDVISPDGEFTTRYALLKRAISIPTEQQLNKCDSYLFEFTILPDNSTALCDVLAAARDCGLTLYKVDSLPLSYSDSEFSFDVILKVGKIEELEVFLLFLSLAIPQYVPLGLYPHIKSRAR